jgi:hypothetical protein
MSVEVDAGNPAKVRVYADHVAETLISGISTGP